MKILGISGSLRKDSFNTRLLRACEAYLPSGVQMEHFNLGEIPLYNADLDGETKPQPVQRLLDAVQGCDAILIATPEYNHSIPGLLKNAIDWASRPAYASVLAGKPAAIVSASVATVGGARSQAHLKKVLDSTLMVVYPAVEMLVPKAAGKFDDAGRVGNAQSQSQLKKYITGFVAWLEAFLEE